jgi:hypothetical protein
MAKLPPTPQAWNDRSDHAPETRWPDSGPSMEPGGLLDGWQKPDWSLEKGGLGLLLHPQTIAQIDFGDKRGRTGATAASATAPRDGLALDANGNPNTQSVATTDRRSSGLGGLSARYESRGNPGTVSSGRDDRGGVSYGTYQLATNTGDAAAFVASPEFRPWARDFEHLTPATAAFGNQWQAVAARDPDTFQQAQHAYIRRTHYDPVVSQVNRNIGYDLDNASDAVRDAAWSTSVQHGTAARILTDALRRTDQALPRTDPNYESRLIDNIYDRRTELATQLRNGAIANNMVGRAREYNNVINNRYPQERADA